MDAAAMQFERRFHISSDASEDREQQVDIQILNHYQKNILIFDCNFVFST